MTSGSSFIPASAQQNIDISIFIVCKKTDNLLTDVAISLVQYDEQRYILDNLLLLSHNSKQKISKLFVTNK